MGAVDEVPTRSNKPLTFLGVRNLIAWLESPLGAEVKKTLEDRWMPDLEGVLWTTEEGRRLQGEVLLRAGKETRAIVVVEPYKPNEAHLRVYGPRELHVKVVTLPMAECPTPEVQRTLEKLVEVELHRTYQPHYYPSCVRASETIEILTPVEFRNRELQKECDKLALEALKKRKGS
jgi:hypothetical protein